MIKVKNIYYMLAYAYRFLKEDEHSSIEAEKFENAEDLCASLLALAVAKQLKQGVAKDYRTRTEVLSSPRGKIDVTSSVKEMTVLHNKLVCVNDHFTEDILINQILKATMNYLVKSEQVQPYTKKRLKRLLTYFLDVETINLLKVEWQRVRFHRHTGTYRLSISVCHFITTGLIHSEMKGGTSVFNFSDDQALPALYERFVRAYYKKHFPHLKPAASQIAWDLDDEMEKWLPVMKSDITLHHDSRILIIDMKYYQQNLQHNPLYNSRTVRSDNLYQMFAYVKNKDSNQTGTVSGLLLYAQTDDAFQPDERYRIQGNVISVKTLNLNTNFREIRQQLNLIVQDFTGE